MDLTTITNQIVGYVKGINLNSQQQRKVGIVTAAALVSAYALYKQFSKVYKIKNDYLFLLHVVIICLYLY